MRSELAAADGTRSRSHWLEWGPSHDRSHTDGLDEGSVYWRSAGSGRCHAGSRDARAEANLVHELLALTIPERDCLQRSVGLQAAFPPVPAHRGAGDGWCFLYFWHAGLSFCGIEHLGNYCSEFRCRRRQPSGRLGEFLTARYPSSSGRDNLGSGSLRGRAVSMKGKCLQRRVVCGCSMTLAMVASQRAHGKSR